MSRPVVHRDGSPETGVRRSLPVHGPPEPIVPLGAGTGCAFFMQGGPSACRNGDKCPYSHDPNKPVSAHVYARVRGPRDDFAQSRSRKVQPQSRALVTYSLRLPERPPDIVIGHASTAKTQP